MIDQLGQEQGSLALLVERPPAGMRAALHRYLRAHSGETITRGRLAAEVWGMSHFRASRTVDQTISVLRKHLPPDERIITVFRVGYRHEVQGQSEG